MTLQEVETFTNDTVNYLISKNPDLAADQEKWVYAQTVKLGEEVGELNEAVLAHFQRQRSSKAHKEYDLEGELADVILATFVLSHQLGVDVLPALEQKMAKIVSRRVEN